MEDLIRAEGLDRGGDPRNPLLPPVREANLDAAREVLEDRDGSRKDFYFIDALAFQDLGLLADALKNHLLLGGRGLLRRIGLQTRAQTLLQLVQEIDAPRRGLMRLGVLLLRVELAACCGRQRSRGRRSQRQALRFLTRKRSFLAMLFVALRLLALLLALRLLLLLLALLLLALRLLALLLLLSRLLLLLRRLICISIHLLLPRQECFAFNEAMVSPQMNVVCDVNLLCFQMQPNKE